MSTSRFPVTVVTGAWVALLASACARPPVLTAPVPSTSTAIAFAAAAPLANASAADLNASPAIAQPCIDCGVAPSEGEVLRAITMRVADLKARGGQ